MKKLLFLTLLLAMIGTTAFASGGIQKEMQQKTQKYHKHHKKHHKHFKRHHSHNRMATKRH